MSVETLTPPNDTYGSGEARNDHVYDLDETRWLALPDNAKVALAIAELAVTRESFEHADDITEALASMTLLGNKKALQEANRSLLKENYLERTGFAADGTARVRLELNEKGHRFVEKSIIKVQ